MQIFKVRISHGARIDMVELRKFLKAMMTVEGAIRYANNMREEIKMLALYANLYGKSTSLTLRQIHPEARRMVSHNRRWIYVYHIEEDVVIVDRILPAKTNKGWEVGVTMKVRVCHRVRSICNRLRKYFGESLGSSLFLFYLCNGVFMFQCPWGPEDGRAEAIRLQNFCGSIDQLAQAAGAI